MFHKNLKFRDIVYSAVVVTLHTALMTGLILAIVTLFSSCAKVSKDEAKTTSGAQGPAGPPGASGPTGATGPTGADGQNGTSLFSTVIPVTPCGGASSPYKEVLLFLADCSLLSSFSADASALNTRFTLVPDGTYVNTDSSGCQFTVSTAGHDRMIYWPGGTNAYSTWQADHIICVLP